MSNFSPFPKYFQYISYFRSQTTYFICEIWLLDLFFSSVLQIWYVKVWISRSISESPFGFEITRVNCIVKKIKKKKKKPYLARALLWESFDGHNHSWKRLSQKFPLTADTAILADAQHCIFGYKMGIFHPEWPQISEWVLFNSAVRLFFFQKVFPFQNNTIRKIVKPVL